MSGVVNNILNEKEQRDQHLEGQSSDLATRSTILRSMPAACPAETDQAMKPRRAQIQSEGSALTSMFSGTAATTSSNNLSTAVNTSSYSSITTAGTTKTTSTTA